MIRTVAARNLRALRIARPLFVGMAATVALMFGSTAAQAQAPAVSASSPISTSAPSAEESNVIPIPPANWLFVQTGQSFTFDGKTLKIRGVSPQTLMFSDRPERMTGDVLTHKFVEFWNHGKDDFQKDPPNATISTVIDGKTDLVVVELLNPRREADELIYDIKLLNGTMPPEGKQISLFIDWWYGPGWRYGWGPGVYVGTYPPPPPPWTYGRCWRGPYGGLHCRPSWGY